jgi:glycosyltransferase involved in cell wall biosynthesis
VISYSPVYLHEGPPGTALRISRELAKRGHEVTIFTGDASRVKSRLKVRDNPMYVDGVEILHFRNLSNRLAGANIPVAPSMASELKKHLGDFDVIHLHEYRTFNAALVHRYAKKKNVPFILQPHGSLPTVRGNVAERQNIRSAFDSIYGFRVLRDAHIVIVSTERGAHQCKQMGVDQHNIRIIPNAVDLKDYTNLPGKGGFRQKYGLEKEDKLVLCLGRIHKVKGIDLLLDAFASISKELRSAHLIIAGPDDGFLAVLRKKAYDMQIRDRVVFTGPLYGRSKLEAFNDADVYVLPSKYESFSNSVLEASACGVPVIVTDTCDIAGVVEKYGLVVEYDAHQLSDALLNILNDDKGRCELAEKGKALVQKEFRLDKVIEEVEKTYREAISN